MTRDWLYYRWSTGFLELDDAYWCADRGAICMIMYRVAGVWS